MNKISFKGTFIHSRTIKQKLDNRYIPVKSSFIGLNPNDSNDLKTLSNINKSWNTEFSTAIYQSALHYNKSLQKTNRKYYALTLQEDNFQSMDYKKILGIAEFENKEDINKIVLLQVNPRYINNDSQKSFLSKIFSKFFKTRNDTLPLYKNIGSGILDSFKEISDKSLELFAFRNTKDFYKKNGFKNPFNLEYFIWVKKL